MHLKNVIFYLTITSIATESLRYYVGFDFKYFYIVIFLCSFIFLIFNKFRYSKGLLIFHSYIFITGLLSCIFGYNKLGYFLGQMFFLLIIPTYYYSFFKFFEDRLSEIVSFYCKMIVALAIIGFIMLPYDLRNGNSLHSILLEPAHYCTLVLPALFITFRDKSYPRWYSIVILASIIVSGSSLGFIGIGIGLMLLPAKFSFKRSLGALTITVLFALLAYKVFPPFMVRFDDTVASSTSKDLSTSNLSTYALLSNFFVSVESFKANPLFGNGIGSHTVSRYLYLNKVDGIEVFEELGMDHLNAQDAASLFSRVLSEMGLVGLILIGVFIFRFYVPNNKKGSLSRSTIVSRSILIYFFCKLFREGHYFSPEMYFFVMLYVFNRYRYLTSSQIK